MRPMIAVAVLFVMFRAEVLGGGQNDHVHATVNCLSVRVEADETPLPWHIDLFGKPSMGFPIVIGLLPLGEMGQAGLEPVLEQIGHGPESC